MSRSPPAWAWRWPTAARPATCGATPMWRSPGLKSPGEDGSRCMRRIRTRTSCAALSWPVTCIGPSATGSLNWTTSRSSSWPARGWRARRHWPRGGATAALAAWRREGVTVPPGEFLDVAESSGVVVALGDWMLGEACAQAMAWRRSGLEIDIWVRCTQRLVAADRFTESVLAALAASGLPSGALTLEIAERVLIDRGGAVRSALDDVREGGVRLAIGASGTDYAALTQLRQLPVDVIKIGSPLVAGLGTDATMAPLLRG